MRNIIAIGTLDYLYIKKSNTPFSYMLFKKLYSSSYDIFVYNIRIYIEKLRFKLQDIYIPYYSRGMIKKVCRVDM